MKKYTITEKQFDEAMDREALRLDKIEDESRRRELLEEVDEEAERLDPDHLSRL